MSLFRKHPDLLILIGLSFLTLGITLPFLGHAFYIDEPLFMRIARQIQSEPLNPYGFYYQWNLYPEPMHKIAAFPPVFSYYLAWVSGGTLFPSEWVIHLSLVPFAMISVLCMYAFARQMELSRGESAFGAALLAVSPAFVVSSVMAMPDVATLAMVLLSTVLAIYGWKREKSVPLILSGICLGLAALLRYNGAPMILILALLGLAFQRRKAMVFLPSAVGGFFVVAWLVVSGLSGGESHASEVLSIFAKFNGWMSRFWSMNIHLSLSTFIPFLLLPLFWKRRFWWWAVVAFFCVDFATIGSDGIKRFAFFPDILFFALGFAMLLELTGVFFLSWSKLKIIELDQESDDSHLGIRLRLKKLSHLYKSQEWLDIVFILWIAVMLFIPIIYVHFATKYLLLMQAPLLVIVIKKTRDFSILRLRNLSWGLAPALALSLLVAWADFSYANLYREEARAAQAQIFRPLNKSLQSPDAWVWFTGHWGWQYYLEKEGGIPLPALTENLNLGDWVLTSKFASATDLTSSLEDKLVQEVSKTKMISVPIRTMNPYARAGFYSNHWGPLPYNFSTTPAEVFNYFQVKP